MLSGGSLPPSLIPVVPARGEWRRAVAGNRGLLFTVGIMMAVAVMATFM
jgi:hypothetical protein